MRKIIVAFFVLLLSGCAATVGPQVKQEIIFVKHKGVAARVAKSVKVPLILEHDGKTYYEEKDIGGFWVISPDVKEENDKAVKAETAKENK